MEVLENAVGGSGNPGYFEYLRYTDFGHNIAPYRKPDNSEFDLFYWAVKHIFIDNANCIRVTTPLKNNEFPVNEPLTIQWVSNGVISDVKIEYSIGWGIPFWEELISSTVNDDEYIWDAPQVVSNYYRLRISNIVSNKVPTYETRYYFKIVE